MNLRARRYPERRGQCRGMSLDPPARTCARPGTRIGDRRAEARCGPRTVIAPDADAKLFVTARIEVRAQRRFEELKRLARTVTLEDVLIDLEARDARDANRATAPLAMAQDAVLLETSDLAIDAAVQRAIALAEAQVSEARRNRRTPPRS